MGWVLQEALCGTVYVRRIAALGVVAAGFLFAFWALISGHDSQKVAVARATVNHSLDAEYLPSALAASSASSPVLYPYSVIPGGAHSAHELQLAIAHDPVVASHYQGFDASEAHIVRLASDRIVFVSYRLDDRVFWTKRTVRLAQGELLISDGAHLARTRCGNRVSETPEAPTSESQPQMEALENPVQLELVPVEEVPLTSSAKLPPITTESSGSIGIPPIIPIFWITGSHSSPSPPIVPPPPPVSSPEPDTLMLLAAATAALLARSVYRRWLKKTPSA
jgi:hypothetical protein